MVVAALRQLVGLFACDVAQLLLDLGPRQRAVGGEVDQVLVLRVEFLELCRDLLAQQACTGWPWCVGRSRKVRQATTPLPGEQVIDLHVGVVWTDRAQLGEESFGSRRRASPASQAKAAARPRLRSARAGGRRGGPGVVTRTRVAEREQGQGRGRRRRPAVQATTPARWSTRSPSRSSSWPRRW